MYSLMLSFYEVRVKINSDTEKLIENIQRDFSFFKSPPNKPCVTINTHHVLPPYDTLPSMQASYVSPRNICYYHQGLKYIDYSGDALVIYNKKESRCDIYSNSYSLLHEVCYMAILSLVNERLDKKHIHRIHGLGLAIENKAALVLLEMSGGKSTLAIQILMSNKNIKLISEDSPLINPAGEILPFPIRIGLRPEEIPSEIPKEYQRYFQRQEFGPKVLIDIDYFKDKICSCPCQPYIIILGRRVLGRHCEIRPCSKYQALKEFVKNSVIGLGLYQGIEYVFQRGPKEVIGKVPLGFSRLNNALKVINKSETFELLFGPDKEKNSQILSDFLSAVSFSRQ